MFGLVKEVFHYCTKDWGLETLMEELHCVRKIFYASEDFEGKGLHMKAEEILNMLGKKLILPMDACNNMLQFFKNRVTEFSITGSPSKNIIGTPANQHAEALPHPSSTTVTPFKSALNFRPTSSIIETKIHALKTDQNLLHLNPISPQGRMMAFRAWKLL